MKVIPNNRYFLCAVYYNPRYHKIVYIFDFGIQFRITLSLIILGAFIFISHKIEFFENGSLNVFVNLEFGKSSWKYIRWKFTNLSYIKSLYAILPSNSKYFQSSLYWFPLIEGNFRTSTCVRVHFASSTICLKRA